MSGEAKLAGPVPSIENQPYWDAAREGRLLIKHCNGCGKNHFYPRDICPFCFSDETVWLEASGRGTVYSHATTYMGPEPYVFAMVTLEEGPTMVTNLVGEAKPAIGQAVVVRFLETDSDPIPVFAAAD